LERANGEKERLIAALRERSRLLERETQEDPLTGIANRRHFSQRLDDEIQVALSVGQPLTLAVADLDRFKEINDRLGHAIGDEVLRQTAGLMRDLCRTTDLVARIGGEEFALILPGMARHSAVHFCEVLRARIESHDWGRVHPDLKVTLSIGLAQWEGSGSTGDLLQAADTRLYRAKRAGRNRVACPWRAATYEIERPARRRVAGRATWRTSLPRPPASPARACAGCRSRPGGCGARSRPARNARSLRRRARNRPPAIPPPRPPRATAWRTRASPGGATARGSAPRRTWSPWAFRSASTPARASRGRPPAGRGARRRSRRAPRRRIAVRAAPGSHPPGSASGSRSRDSSSCGRARGSSTGCRRRSPRASRPSNGSSTGT